MKMSVKTQGVTLRRVQVAHCQALAETGEALLGDFLGIPFIHSSCHAKKLCPHLFPGSAKHWVPIEISMILKCLQDIQAYPFPEMMAEDCTSTGDRTLVDWIGTIQLLKFSQIHDGIFKEFWFDPYLDKQCRHFTLVSDNNSALIPKQEFIPYLNIFLSKSEFSPCTPSCCFYPRKIWQENQGTIESAEGG